MFKKPGRYIALVVSALVVVVVASVLLRQRTHDVAMPPPDATPEQVVTAYIDALNAHACETAEALMTDDAKYLARSWCNDVASMREVTVHHQHLSGSSGVKEMADVHVTFDLDWRLGHNDGSMDEGDTTWGYRLVRVSPNPRWRIFDEGTG